MSAITDDYEKFGFPNYLEVVEKLESPRIVKTHLSWDMIPAQIAEKNAKVIYVTRNPRDACVSFYNHWKLLEGYSDTFEAFAEVFLEDICGYYTPFIQHVLGYWNQRHLPNVLFITFEEMKSDLSKVVDKVSNFLGKSINSTDKPKLLKHLSFDSMKSNSAVNKQDLVQLCKEHFNTADGGVFMRKGKTGNWKEHFSKELTQKFRDWEEKQLEGSDLKFTYEL